MSEYASLGLPLIHAGKVRELYAWPPGAAGVSSGQMLMVASDRVSAFDHVLTPPIPGKGTVLTQMSLWWFDHLTDLLPNHVLSTDVPDAVAGRALVCETLRMAPIECVARGYLTGSGWAEYQQTQSVCGVRLPSGLEDGSRLPEPIFTPATKAALGEHDENIDFAGVVDRVGDLVAARLRDLTLAIYRRGDELARQQGMILADTKVEFGLRGDGTIVLADEVLTPDSSRFWDAATWQPGVRLDSFDKQFLRDWLVKESGWDRASDEPPPMLPSHIVRATRERYVDAYHRITGEQFHG